LDAARTSVNPSSFDLKIARAREHLEVLKKEIVAFIKSDAHVVRLDEHSDNVRLIFGLDAPPPARLSVLIGDVVHNARSALDHLANDLVRADGNTPHSRCAFPVFDTKVGFEKHGLPLIAGMNPDALCAIRWLQPYHSGIEFRMHFLWILHYLWNTDKHRQLNAVNGFNFTHAINLLERGPLPDAPGPLACFPSTFTPGVVHDGEELATFPMTRTEMQARQLDVEVDGATLVCLDESPEWKSWGVEVVLEAILTYIESVVLPPLRPFLHR
jgi:hypothetical protein